MMLSSLSAIVPMACVAAAGIASMTAEAFRAPGERMPIGPLGAIGLVGAGVAALLLWDRHATSYGVVTADNFGLFVTVLLVVIGLLSIALSPPTIDREGLPRGEYYALMLFSLAGMMLMATASDLLLIFLALEVLSLAVYVLTGLRRDSPTSVEAALKYFLLGAFSSAFFLYGIALTYGLTGTTRLDRIGRLLATQALRPTPLELAAVAFLFVGFAFKVSAVPFHMWTPDAYEGAPPAVTGFMSDRRQGGGLCGLRARVPFRLRALARRLEPGRFRCRGGDDDRRGRGGRGADQREADAGVFEHRARRVPARRAGVRERCGEERRALLPRHLRRDQPGRVRRHRAPRDAPIGRTIA